MLERSWGLMRECRRFLQENERSWQDHRDEMERKEEDMARMTRVKRAEEKTKVYKEKQKLK